MSTASNLMTAEELLSRTEFDKHCQLIRGELVTMSPASHRHGEVASEIGRQLRNHVRQKKLGKVYAAETGFLVEREPDTVLAPDAAYVANERLTNEMVKSSFLPLAPDFVAEVRSDRDSTPAMNRKAMAWLEFGCKVVITADPEAETVCRYQSTGEVDTFAKGDSVECSAAVPGWVLNTIELFED